MLRKLKSKKGAAMEMAMVTLAISAAVCIIIVTATLINAREYRQENKAFVNDTKVESIAEDFSYAYMTGNITTFTKKYKDNLKQNVDKSISEENEIITYNLTHPDREKEYTPYEIPDYVIDITPNTKTETVNNKEVTQIVSYTLMVYKDYQTNSDGSNSIKTVTVNIAKTSENNTRTIESWD